MTQERIEELKKWQAELTDGASMYKVAGLIELAEDFEKQANLLQWAIALLDTAMPSDAEVTKKQIGNNRSICDICQHHAPFDICEPCANECHGNSHFLTKENQTDWKTLYRQKEVEREGTQNALDDARRKIRDYEQDLAELKENYRKATERRRVRDAKVHV